jgi:vacuolar-type H+-ATPase subunit F/Vma7
MRVFVIGDEDTVVGFRFAGVAGTVVEGREEALRALNEAMERQEAIVIIAEPVANTIREEISRIRYYEALPLIVEVPGRQGPLGEAPPLFRLIRESVGIKF